MSVTGSHKCDCPFRISGLDLGDGKGWKLEVKSGVHNHKPCDNFEGHAFVGRPNREENELIQNLTKAGVKPKRILINLKQRNKDNSTTLRQVNNERQRYKKSVRHPRTQMQHLLHRLTSSGYVTHYVKDDESDVLKVIFLAHPTGISLFHSFSNVLVMDNTYKTNRYRYPLLEIVGQTSTEKTFNVAFCYMEAEKGSYFTWALERLRNLIERDDALPQVIVTDKEDALILAINKVFPTATHMLCKLHIKKNVLSNVRKWVRDSKDVTPIMDAWKAVVESQDLKEYEDNLKKFKDLSGTLIFNYVAKTYLERNKEKFVHVWVNKVMHFGNTTTNR